MADLLKWLGGAAKSIGNVASGVERQLNPFDGGATYNNPNPQPAPQQQAAPQAPQQPMLPPAVSNVMHFAMNPVGETADFVGNLISKAPVPFTGGNNMPNVSVGEVAQQVPGVALNMAKGALSGVNDFGRGIAYGAPVVGIDAQAENYANKNMNQLDQEQAGYDQRLKTGQITPDVWQKLSKTVTDRRQNMSDYLTKTVSEGPTAKQAIAGAANTALMIATAGLGSGEAAGGSAAMETGKLFMPTAEEAAANIAANGVAHPLLKAMAQGAALNGAQGAASSGVQAWGDNKGAGDIAKSALVGGATGAATGAAFAAGGYGLQKLAQSEAAQNAAKNAATTLADERGSVPLPGRSLPDSVPAGPGDTFYHGTSKADAESLVKNGFNPKLSAKGDSAESPYALFASTEKGTGSDHAAGTYGNAIVNIKPKDNVNLLDSNSQTWLDTMGKSKGADESAKIAAQLKQMGYDGIKEANGEVTIINPNKFDFSIDRSTGEQLGRLRAQIASETDPNVKSDLIQQERSLAGQYAGEKTAQQQAAATVSDDEVSKYAKSFGLSEDQARKDLVSTKANDILRQTDVASAKQIKDNGIVNPVTDKTAPQTATATDEAINRMRTAEENTALNPTKRTFNPIKEGDYQSARLLPGEVQNQIETRTQQAIRAVNKLSPEEQQTFMKAVEDPSLVKTPQMQEAVRRWTDLTDTTHAINQGLGGNTNYVDKYARHNWDLSAPEDQQKMLDIISARLGKPVKPEDFGGIDNMPRIFNSIQEGEQAGFKLKDQPLAQQIAEYGSSSAGALKKQALIKGFTEADSANATAEGAKRSFDLKNGTVIPLSNEGIKNIKGFDYVGATDNPLIAGYRGGNRTLKGTLLSASEFHPVNVVGLRAAPTLAMEGHPVLAARGLYDTFRSQVGNEYADNLMQKAVDDGTADFGAKIGAPLLHGSDFSTGGAVDLSHLNVGEKTIFQKAMPSFQYRALQAAKSDLDARNIPYDSPEAQKLGERIYNMMGFVNTESQNLDPRAQRVLGDFLLAPQFTRSKVQTLKAALTEGGLAGSYARRSIVANTIANIGLAVAGGTLVHQEGDNLKDMALRGIFHPSIPTPWQDDKGNTMELKLPSGELSEPLGVLGFSLKRNPDTGHLSVDWSPGNVPGNVANWGRSRLAVLPGDALKVATNENYAHKPLYDPNASTGTKVAQAATTLATGALPIGLQGITQLDAVKSHLPESVQQVLDAQSTGSNPLLKSAASSFGLTPQTDKTVGKGLETSTYFSALDDAKKGLNRQEKDALDLYSGSKKNPVTGAYDVMPTVDDQRAKATTLLQNPNVIDKLIEVNQKVGEAGGSVDPLWQMPKDQITKYFQYQAMPPHGPDQTAWKNENKGWYPDLQKARTGFFDALPAGDPNKPAAPIEYPTADAGTQKVMDQYFNTTDSATRQALLQANPGLQDQFNKQDDYYNQMRVAQGYNAFKGYPTPAAPLQKFIDSYMGADKTARKGIRNSNPGMYQQMSAYFDSADLYNIGKTASVNALQGQPDTTDKELKQIAGLSKDIYQNPNGTYNIQPAGWMNGAGGSCGGCGGSGGGGSRTAGARMPSARIPSSAGRFKVASSTAGFSKLMKAGNSIKAKSVKKTFKAGKMAKVTQISISKVKLA